MPPPETKTTLGISTGSELWVWQRHCELPKSQQAVHIFEISLNMCISWDEFISQPSEAIDPEANRLPPSIRNREMNAILIAVSRLLLDFIFMMS